jgi:hypothetical protein
MVNSVMLPRKLLILAIVLPLAAVVGYKLATPESLTTLGLMGLMLFTLCIPLLIKWHHPMLIFAWNAAINLTFLPGSPALWVVFSGLSFFFSVLDRLLTKQPSFQRVPSLIWPLLFLGLVVLATAGLNGGISLYSMGSEAAGGKRYIYVLLSVLGFFALIGRRIPVEKANLYTGLFLLSGLTWMAPNLIYPFPPLYFLYYIFSTDSAVTQAMSDLSRGAVLMRLNGLGFAGGFLFYYLCMRFGIRGIMDVSKPWRIIAFCAVLFVAMFGGFRSILVMAGLMFLIQFFIEKVYQTRLALAFCVVAVLIGAFLTAFSDKLPLPVQRSLSIVPGLEIDPVVKYDAMATTEWRLQMWQLLLPQIPRYFWVGKGYLMDPTEYYLTSEAVKRGLAQDIDATMVTGGYHSGPLTLMIHLGVFGVIAFGWFVAVAFGALYKNYKYGDGRLRGINLFLLAYFLMRLLYFLVFYGHFAEDFFIFTGIAGLSVSLNGGICRSAELRVLSPSAVPVPEPVPLRA